MAKIVNFMPTPPPDMVVDVNGAVVDSVDYKFTAPISAHDPILFEAPDGTKLNWTPTDLVYKDEDGILDYIVGSSPDTLQAYGKIARYARTFPFASDIFQAQAGKIKHWTVLDQSPRPPADYLGQNIMFGISGDIDGIVLPIGIHNDIEVGSFRLPQPSITDLAGNSITGFYEVVNSDQGQTLFIWLPYKYMVDAVYPIMIDPTVIIGASYSFGDYGSGGRKIITLSNWWHVVGMYDTPNNMLRLYVSKDYGSTWTQLCYLPITSYNWNNGFAVASNGNTVYVCANVSSDTTSQIEVWSFDATTVSNTAQNPIAFLGYWGLGNSSYISMTVGSNGYLHIAVIRNDSSALTKQCQYYMSSNGGVSWTGPSTIDTAYISGGDMNGCCVVIPKGGNDPVILYTTRNAGTFQIKSRSLHGTSIVSQWLNSITGTSLSAAFDNLGNLHLVILLYSGAIYNVAYYKSTDGGVTWGSQTLITSGSTYNQKSAQIGIDSNNYLRVIVHGADATSSDRVKLFTFGSSWDSGLVLTSSGGNTGVIVERQISINLPYSYYDSSLYSMEVDKIVSDNPPTAPTGLIGPNFDATTVSTFTWIFSDPDGGDTQSAFQFQIFRVSDSVMVVDTGKITSSGTVMYVAVGYLTNNTAYQWRVSCWDQSGAQSPWSALASFECYVPPTVEITSPTNGGVNQTSSVGVSWNFIDSYGTQSKYLVQLQDSASNILWNSDWIMGSSTNLLIPVPVVNNSSYKILVRVYSTTGMESMDYINSFTTAFTYPAQPSILITNNSAITASISMVITNPTPTGGQPIVSGNDLYRQNVGDVIWTRIASNITGAYTDYAVCSGQIYVYKVSALGVNDVRIDSPIVQSVVTLHGIWLYDVSNPSGTIINIPCNDGRAETWTPDASIMTFAGRKGRVIEFGIGEDVKYTVNLKMEATKPHWNQLKSLALTRPTLCVRDYRGRKIFGVISGLPEVDSFYGQTITLEVDQIDYSEAI